MTNTKRTLKGLLSVLLSLAISVAMCVSMLAFASTTITETVVVEQIIEKGYTPQRTSYTYVLTPKNAENPMPDGTVGGKYTLPTVVGDTTRTTAPTFTLEIDKTKPGVYEYYLEKIEKTPEGDTVTPEKHIFGYNVRLNSEGEIEVIPVICQSGVATELKEFDENGNPTKIVLVNTVKGVKSPTSSTQSTTTTTKKGYTTKTYSSTRTTSRTTTRGGWINTGDESNLIMWVAILGVAVIGLLVVILLRKRRDDDDEENI